MRRRALAKIDFRRELAHLYYASETSVIQVDVPPMQYLMLDRAGDPADSRADADAVQALFSVSYAIKVRIRRGAAALDYRVMPLEGLWWIDQPSRSSAEARPNWHRTMMIMQPFLVERSLFDDALLAAGRKADPATIAKLRLATLSEGASAQILHIGPFSEAGRTIARLDASIAGRGAASGTRHEIYLSDARRIHPTHWRTIIRQSVDSTNTSADSRADSGGSESMT